jgi:hypothetical protein
MRILGERMPCVVPFCRRTLSLEKYPNTSEFLCGKHYRLARRTTRARYRKLERAAGKYPLTIWCYKPGSPERLAAVKAHRAAALGWRRVKAEAIEAAGGIR